MTTFEPGSRFDRYVIEGVLGEGGMGRVYRAYDTRLGRKVALKLLRPEAGAESGASVNSKAEASARMLREARSAAQLDHPNAATVFDVGEHEGALYISMELVSGKTLRAYVGDREASWETKIKWLMSAAAALHAAHERNIVHRDVKPENIMVRDDGVVKVLDFGIAKRLKLDVGEEGTTSQTGTGAGVMLGTPRYLSPEQIRGEQVDGRADQFAWGVVAYELLTGVFPWKSGAGIQLLLAILSGSLDPPSKHVPGLPAVVDGAIMKAVAKTPSERFASMDQVVRALEDVVTPSRRIISIDPQIATEPAPGQKKRGVMIAGIGALLACGALVFYLATRPRPPHPIAMAVPDAAPSATSLIDLAQPASTVPEARAAFAAYQTAFRDSSWESARQNLERATSLDPTMAAAHLRLAYMSSLVSTDEAEVRRSFKKAVQFRSSLTERDQALLDAMEPLLQREPSDTAECEKRLAALSNRYPQDAELAFYLGSVRFDRGKLAQALEALDRAILVDPRFIQALSTRGGVLSYMGRLDEAKQMFARCTELSRSSTEALWYMAMIHEQEGSCEAEEADARQWIARDPEDYLAYQWLARALQGKGAPVDAVQAALEQKWSRVAEHRRARIELADRVRLDLLTGDLAAAEKKTTELERLLSTEPGALAHAETHIFLVQIYEETGRPDDAKRVADAFLKRKDAWVTPIRVDDRAIWEDPVPRLLGVMLHTGALAEVDFQTKRDEWMKSWESKAGDYVNYLWINGYGVPTETGKEAEAALRAKQRYEPTPPFMAQSISPAYVGKVLLLGGRVDDAIPYLEHATRSCVALQEPIEHQRAYLRLGAAREAKGEKEAACSAYGKLLARWRRVTPKAKTAEQARARSLALRCQ
jgi:serine/threonine-protein kinase